MKKPLLAFALFSAILASPCEVFALPPDLAPPPAAFGDAERDGTLLVTDDLREVDFGGGLRLPVRWVYRSSNQATNAYGWDGFSLTLLEAKAVKKNEILYEVTLLCGKVIYFNKQPFGVTPAWKSNDLQWGGVEDSVNGKFTITSWDGWSLEYKDGRIKKLVTEDSRTLLWAYDSTDVRLVTSIKESGEAPELEVQISNDPLDMAGSSAVRGASKITVNGDIYTLKYANGTLQNINFPDGRKTQWRFEQNGDEENEKRLTLTQESGWWRSWVFFGETRKLKTDDVWSYSIVGGEASTDGVVYGRPTMERTRVATGEKETVEYEASNSIIVSTDVLGNVSKNYVYKTPGKLYDKPFKVERKRFGESVFTSVWRGTYDAGTGDLIRSYDAEDNETVFAYERFSGASEFLPPKKVSVTDPLGRVSTFERDIAGNLVETIDAAAVKRKFEWDSRRRLTRVKNATNDVLLRYVYGDKDQILERYNALGNKTEFEYEVHLGEPLLTKITSPLGRVTEWTRDGKGRVTDSKTPSGALWTYSYVDDWSVLDTRIDPLSNLTEYDHDSRLNEIRVTDPLNRNTEIEYDDLNLPSEVSDALNQTTKFEWNANRDVKKLTDPRNKVYSMKWESAGQRKELQWPDSKKQSVSFNAGGKVTSFQPRSTDATVTNAWNTAGQATGLGWINGLNTGTTSVSRNAVGQLTGSYAATMSLAVSGSFSYDSEGRLATSSQTVGSLTRTASLTYDLQGRITAVTYPAGFVVEYLRNDDGAVTAIKKDGTTLASYGYDAAGRLTTRTLSSGAVTAYGYDGMDRVNKIVVTSGTGTLWAERYGYNAAGDRVFTLSGTSGTVGDAYQFDANSQLTGVKYGATGADSGYAAASSPVSVEGWAYDAAGNRQTAFSASGTTSYTVDSVNQYTAVGSDSPSYSPRGDLSMRGNWEYSYDAFGNLIQAHNTNTSTLAKYWRDAIGRRAVKDINGGKTVYFNLGTARLESYAVTTDEVSSTIYGPGIEHPLAEVRPDGSVQFYHQDWLSNVVMLTNNSGSKVQTYRYDVWGKVSGFDGAGLPILTSAILSSFLFTGHEFDLETGLYHCRARAYSGDLGRFMQFDPIDFTGNDYNLVRYVANDPINFIDSLGLDMSGVTCGCEDLCGSLRGLTTGIRALTDTMQGGGYDNLGQLLDMTAANGGIIIGDRGFFTGVLTGAGRELSRGMQNITMFFEKDRNFNARNKHPGVNQAGVSQAYYAQLWGEAEVDRIQRGIDEINAEIARRGCSCD